jgi:glutamine cyclotransferase
LIILVLWSSKKIKSINELEWINGKYTNVWKDAIAVVNQKVVAVEGI